MTHRDLPIEPPAPAIPDDNAPLPPARRGTRWTVRRGRTIAFVLVGLAVGVSLLSVYATYQAAQESAAQAAAVDQRLAVLEEFVQGRGEYRDREAERLQREIRDGICDLLDQLPPSPLLDVPRNKYGCGPGAPGVIEQQPTASDLEGGESQAAAMPQSSTSTTEVPAPAAGAPTAMALPQPPPLASSPPPESPPDVPTAPPAGPPRVLDLEPLTDPLCAVLGVCL